MTKTKLESWSLELTKLFDNEYADFNEMKLFISELLSEQREQILSCLPGRRILGEDAVYFWETDMFSEPKTIPSNLEKEMIVGWNSFREQFLNNLKEKYE